MSVFHPQTQQLLVTLADTMPQSLLLTGSKGVSLNNAVHELTKTGTIRHQITPDTSKASPIITVEMVREIHVSSRTKTTSRQFIVIKDVDTMSTAAQAAFLKLLEEPQPSVHYILTTNRPDKLLATITSRVQHHIIRPITAGQSEVFLDDLGIQDTIKRNQLLFIASGLAEELEKLVANDEYFNLHAELMVDARDLIQKGSYHKLLLAQKYKDDRQASLLLIDTAIKLLRKNISNQPQQVLLEKIERFTKLRERLATNGNIRLQIAAFVI